MYVYVSFTRPSRMLFINFKVCLKSFRKEEAAFGVAICDFLFSTNRHTIRQLRLQKYTHFCLFFNNWLPGGIRFKLNHVSQGHSFCVLLIFTPYTTNSATSWLFSTFQTGIPQNLPARTTSFILSTLFFRIQNLDLGPHTYSIVVVYIFWPKRCEFCILNKLICRAQY